MLETTAQAPKTLAINPDALAKAIADAVATIARACQPIAAAPVAAPTTHAQVGVSRELALLIEKHDAAWNAFNSHCERHGFDEGDKHAYMRERLLKIEDDAHRAVLSYQPKTLEDVRALAAHVVRAGKGEAFNENDKAMVLRAIAGK